jgi:aryl-alcohol dehydrogenase-like predicted oxidoreductase
MQRRKLGRSGLEVSAIGLGCMGMAGTSGMRAMYGEVDVDEAIATIHRAIDLGIDFFDTAEIYGPYLNEELVGRAIRGRREGLVIATKFGFRIVDGRAQGVDSTPENVRRVCDASLKRLNIDCIDLFYQHRVDPNVPIEEAVGAMAELVQAGKVRFLGLSEAAAGTIRRAHAVHPISALQSEYSLWERTIEPDILTTCRELGIGLVPYSPLGRGFLTGQVKRAEEYDEGDYRRSDPRYQGANFDANMRAVAAVKAVADRHGATPAQVALAWLLHQGDDIVPIPGTKRRDRLEENAGAAELRMSAADLRELDAAAPVGATAGERYGNPAMLAMVRR